jgi:hypothetical protein
VPFSGPRYTGRQVWNRRRKDELMLDVHDVALGRRGERVRHQPRRSPGLLRHCYETVEMMNSAFFADEGATSAPPSEVWPVIALPAGLAYLAVKFSVFLTVYFLPA